MKCLNCNSEILELKNVRFSPIVKNEGIDVVVPCNVCKGCNTPLMDAKQINILRRKAADKYREKNSLLTSQQILKYRKNLGMSQLVFAKFLNVGEASVKRWETYYIQDLSQDDHIRVKCDETQAESNYLYLQWRYSKPNIFTGGKKFSLDAVKNVEFHFLKSLPDCGPFLNSLYFYLDFLHFKRFNTGVTGNKYIPFKRGPSPYQFKMISQMIGRSPKPNQSFVAFDDSEKRTIDSICEIYCKIGGESLSDLSNKEKAYVDTHETDFISYKHSSDLLI